MRLDRSQIDNNSSKKVKKTLGNKRYNFLAIFFLTFFLFCIQLQALNLYVTPKQACVPQIQEQTIVNYALTRQTMS